MFATTEITSSKITSDGPIHQRLLFAYHAAQDFVQGSLLEIGCGLGRGIGILKESFEQYTAVDKNQKLMEHLEEKYPSYSFIRASIPPFSGIREDQFDTILSFQVIEHIKKDAFFVEEIYRVLKPGGKAIITTPNAIQSLSRNPWHVREYTPDQLEALLGDSFKKITKLGVFGNKKVMAYHEKNRKSVRAFRKWDLLGMENWLPNVLLRIPYDILNRMNRKKLMRQHDSLVHDITIHDYFLDEVSKECLDLFYLLEK